MEDLCKDLVQSKDMVHSKDLVHSKELARSPDRQDHEEFVLRKKLAD
jgi:hypothetical protein